jgi:hypothetical protein
MPYSYDRPETYPEATRRELVEAANRGLGGQGAVVEGMFRLMDSIAAQEKTTTRLNKLLLWFTIAITAMTAVLVVLGSLPVLHCPL